MATAILDLEYEQLPPEITGLEDYNSALVLIRLRGRPIGQTFLPVVYGKISATKLHDELMHAAYSVFWEQRICNYLGWKEERVANFKPPTATVAICTRDRPDDLRRCLDALIRMPDEGQELLVIDNCPSTDSTRHLVESYGCVRYVCEDRPGLDIARNRALREAQYEIIAFIDDDAAPDQGWLHALLRNFDDPLVSCVTGLTMPMELKTEAQVYFERYSPFGRGFRRIVFENSYFNPMTAGKVGAGVNMALRRKVLECIGPFDEALDAGTPTCSGGDTEMFARVLAAGYRIVYDPSALSWHRHRYTWEELRRTFYGYGVGVYAFWIRSLLIEREVGVLKLAWDWFFHYRLRDLFRSILGRPDSIPLGLLLAELRGCAVAPWKYFSSCKLLKTKKR